MKLKFISHASVIVTTEDLVIWSDPWLTGKAFNDSWSLLPEAYFEPEWFTAITHIWISHEHPDHFHLPTLKSLPEDFKSRVTILFQKNNSDKLTNALSKLGFKNFIRLPHARFIPLTPKTIVWCYQVGQMDSTLAIQSSGQTVYNLNDAEINAYDCKIISKKLPHIDVLLNQFSLAGYNGHQDISTCLPKMADMVLKKVYDNHMSLKAKKTMPFASMIYFSTRDNSYMNEYANSPRKVWDYFAKLGKSNELIFLYPGEEMEIAQGLTQDQLENTLKKYDENFANLDNLSVTEPQVIPYEKLLETFNKLHERIWSRYYKFMFKFILKPIKIYLIDIDKVVMFDLINKKFFETSDRAYDLVVYSQPMQFAMQFDWGFQTLGVSARHKVIKNYQNYRLHRILFSLNNAEIWLKFKLFFNLKNIRWIMGRFNGLLNQIKSRHATQSE